jgi:[acyl-carrier-protein] S-malonyltransferase
MEREASAQMNSGDSAATKIAAVINRAEAPAGPLAWVFPGQGSQRVGMGKSWAQTFEEAAAAFREADRVLGFPLSALCWQGPEDELQLTVNQQPAILTVSVAIQRVLAARGLAPAVVAGHSLGEYSALVAAGTLVFADALRLVRRRGELMQEAVPVGTGAMAAVLGLDAEAVAALAAEAGEGDVCTVANLNAPEQTVIAGHRGAVERAVALASSRGAKRALMLPVSAPFHSPLMAPAREALRPLLEATSFAEPRVPVVTNVDARPARTGEQAREALVRQVDAPVRWVESVRWMAERERVGRWLEVGPGTVLAGMIRRIVPSARPLSVGEAERLDELLEGLG